MRGGRQSRLDWELPEAASPGPGGERAAVRTLAERAGRATCHVAGASGAAVGGEAPREEGGSGWLRAQREGPDGQQQGDAVCVGRVRLCGPVDCSPSGSSVCGILQARTLEWGAMPSSRGSSRPGDRTWVS